MTRDSYLQGGCDVLNFFASMMANLVLGRWFSNAVCKTGSWVGITLLCNLYILHLAQSAPHSFVVQVKGQWVCHSFE